MNLNEFKSHLQNLSDVQFLLPDQSFVPAHFHVTELGLVTKHFIDCGGTVRMEQSISMQLWEANDTEHRLSPEKLMQIIQKSESILGIPAHLPVQIEYQGTTIGIYGVSAHANAFLLNPTQTNCLATDHCGVPPEKIKRNLIDLSTPANACKPGGGCC